MKPSHSPTDRSATRPREPHAPPDPTTQRDHPKPSFSSTKDDPLATAGTGIHDDRDLNTRTGDRSAAPVAEFPTKDEALTEGPGPAEGRTDNKAGG